MNRQDAKDAKKHEEEWSFLFSPLGVLGVLAVLKLQNRS
jgi:hypothetical protein